MTKIDLILTTLDNLFPNARAELDYTNNYELIVAVILSAQTTDIAVNKATPALFKAYPSPKELSKANQEDVGEYIKSIGLYKNKAKFLIKMAQQVMLKHNGKIPSKREDLEALAGVGRKTANVVLANAFGIPTLAVDTHVHRVSKRLGLVEPTANVYETELKLYELFPKDKWIKLHHQLIFFGRYQCLAKKPKCGSCPLYDVCIYEEKERNL